MATTVTRPIILDSTGRELVDVLNNVTISSSNIINNVTSTATDKALAANQGRVLDQTITSKVSALSTEAVGSVSAFSTSSVYPVGSYVTYSGLLYRCKKAVTSAGVWNSANWELVNLQELKNNVESAKRNMGELVFSSVPLVDAGLKLADGSSITSNSAYADFYNYIVSLYNSSSPAVIAGTSADTGKYVYDSANSRIFLPNLNNLFIEGTTTASELGSYLAAGLPNITGDWMGSGLTYGAPQNGSSENYEGALYGGYATERAVSGVLGGNPNYRSDIGQDHIAFDASRSNSIYGNASTVQPPAVKQYIYIVVANVIKDGYTINIDNVMTDVNMLSNRIETTNIANIGIKVDDYHLTEFSGDCNNIAKTGGCFTKSATNTPPSTSNGYLITLAYTNDFIKQIYYPFDSRYEYVRVKTNSGWYSWYCEDLNIWSRLGSYNSTSDYPSASVKSALNTKFQSTSDYSAFYGGDSAAEEFAVYGLKHNSSKGGIAIIMSVAFGIMAGSGSGLPSTWTWRKIWQI